MNAIYIISAREPLVMVSFILVRVNACSDGNGGLLVQRVHTLSRGVEMPRVRLRSSLKNHKAAAPMGNCGF